MNLGHLKQPPETCLVCGADVPRKARACPECGADEKSGWSEEAYAQNLGLPDDNFDYDEFAKREFGAGGKAADQLRPRGISWIWWLVGLGLLALFAFGYLRGLM